MSWQIPRISTAALNINGGTLQIGSNGGLGTGGGQINLNGGTLITVGTFSLDSSGSNKRSVVLGGNGGTFVPTSGTLTVTGVVSGIGSLTVNGSGGIVDLAGTNTYTGATIISSGTLQAGSTQSFGVGSAVTLANVAGAILDLNSKNNTIGSLTGGGPTGGNITLGSGILTVGADNTSPAAYGGAISGTGGLTKTGTGTLTLGGTNSYAGATSINAGGIIIIQNGSALGTTAGSTTVANGATLQLQGNVTTLAEPLTLNGVGASGTTGALENLSGSNTFAGAITASTAPTISADAGTSLSLSGNISGGVGVTFTGSGNILFSGNWATTSGAAFLKSGSGTLTITKSNSPFGVDNIMQGIVVNIKRPAAWLGTKSSSNTNNIFVFAGATPAKCKGIHR